jgi:dihydroorotase
LLRALAVLTSEPARVLGDALGTLQASAGRSSRAASPTSACSTRAGEWTVEPAALRSQGKHTPFSGHQMPARVRWTVVGGQLAYEAPH